MNLSPDFVNILQNPLFHYGLFGLYMTINIIIIQLNRHKAHHTGLLLGTFINTIIFLVIAFFLMNL